MACICDYCDADIRLDDASEDALGKIMCGDCEEEEEQKECVKGPKAQCGKCRTWVRARDLFEKQEAGKLCIHCAHIYELKLFTPPDHKADECELCKENTRRGRK